MTTLERLASESTYAETHKWIYKLVLDMKGKYKRLDMDEAVREAYLGYCEAYKTYNAKTGSFTNWVQVKVRSKLLDLIRNTAIELKKAKRLVRNYEFDTLPSHSVPEFNLREWLSTLSDDARKVAELVVFEPPIDIKLLLKQVGDKRKIAYRLAIKEFLREAKWSKLRIKRTFNEIRRAL